MVIFNSKLLNYQRVHPVTFAQFHEARATWWPPDGYDTNCDKRSCNTWGLGLRKTRWAQELSKSKRNRDIHSDMEELWKMILGIPIIMSIYNIIIIFYPWI